MVFHEWFGSYRYTYNKIVEYNENQLNSDDKDRFNFFTMRNRFVIAKNNDFFEDKEWLLCTPKAVRADAVKQCITAYRSNFTKIKKHTINRFRMSFKSRKQNQSIEIPKTAIKRTDQGFSIYPSYINEPIKIGKRQLKNNLKNILIEKDCRLTFDGIQWHVIVPYDKHVSVNVSKDRSVVALDPGIRTFQTGFSDHEVFEVSSRQINLDKLYKKRAVLQSLRTTSKNKSRYRRKLLKNNIRMRNIVDDIHNRTVNYIRKTYTDVLLPSFESQDMVKSHCLHRSSNKRLLGLQHYKFKQKMLNAVDVNTYIVNEAYTSKTCTSCGEIKYDLGSSKIFHCFTCGMTMDRDFNGARNIYLKYMGGRPNTLKEGL